MKGGTGTDRRRFDDDHADEAARYLDCDVSADDVRPLVRGMDRIARIRAWKAVERTLGRGVGGGPRSDVLALLDDRETVLDEIGERPDRLEHGPYQSYEEWQAGAPPGEGRPSPLEADDDLPAASSEDIVADAFATDGGEQT